MKKSLILHFTFRMLLYGVKQFNLQPERGLKYLEENGFVENNPESVAKFLFRQERLSKKQIGGLITRTITRATNQIFLTFPRHRTIFIVLQASTLEATRSSTKKSCTILSSAMNSPNFYWSKPCGSSYGASGM